MTIQFYQLNGYTILTKAVLTLLASLVCTGLVQADSYLDALNAEVSKPEYVKEAELEIRRISQQQSENNASLSQDVTSAITDVARFENLLHSKYPATYQVYLKLNKTSQSDVYRTFQESRELAETTKRILEIYLR